MQRLATAVVLGLVLGAAPASALGAKPTAYPLPTGEAFRADGTPTKMVTAGDRILFEESEGRIGSIDRAGRFGGPLTPTHPGGVLTDLAALPGDGGLWFTEFGYDANGNPTGGVGHVGGGLYPLPNGDQPRLIVPAPDGKSLWVSGSCINCYPGGDGAVYQVTPTGSITPFPVSWPPGIAMAFGADGALWADDCQLVGDRCSGLERITTAGAETHYATPYPVGYMSPGPGAAWLVYASTEFAVAAASLDGAGAPTITTFTSPLQADGSPLFGAPSGIAYDTARGEMWLAGSPDIIRLTPQGNLDGFRVGSDTGPFGGATTLAVGPDGAIWFADPSHAQIGRLDPSSAPDRCAYAPAVTARLAEAARPYQDLKNALLAMNFASEQAGLLGNIIKVIVIATPVGEEYAAWSTLRFIVSLAQSYTEDKLVDDPPDPNFKAIAAPPRLTLPRLHARRGMSAATARAFNRVLANEARIAGLQLAYLHAVERAQGAHAAADDAWVKRQDLAAATNADKLAKAYAAEPKLLAAERAAARRSPLRRIRVTRASIKRAKRRLAHGLPRPVARRLRRLGLSAADVSGLARELRAAKLKPGSVPSLLGTPAQRRAARAAGSAYENAAKGAQCVGSA
jgi:streptogramin lyase